MTAMHTNPRSVEWSIESAIQALWVECEPSQCADLSGLFSSYSKEHPRVLAWIVLCDWKERNSRNLSGMEVPAGIAEYLRQGLELPPDSERSLQFFAALITFSAEHGVIERPSVLWQGSPEYRADLDLAELVARLEEPILPGDELAHLRCIRRLGRGSFGEVWHALNIPVQRHVAVKILEGASSDDPVPRSVYDEARVAGGIHHENVVEVRHVLALHHPTLGPRALVEMTLCADLHPDGSGVEAGNSLDDIICSARGTRAMDPFHAANVMRGAALGVAAVHDQSRLTHRDIKPSNILVSPRGRAMLVDFGMARLSTEWLASNPLGSPFYMAPEVAEAVGAGTAPPYSFQSDVYALGACLCFALTGEHPYGDEIVLPEDLSSSERRRKLCGRLASADPLYQTLPSWIPPTLVQIIEKATATRPQERYDSATELAADLAAFVDGRSPPIVGTPSPAHSLAITWNRRRPSIAWLGLAAIAVGVGTLAALGRFGVLQELLRGAEGEIAKEAKAKKDESTQWKSLYESTKNRFDSSAARITELEDTVRRERIESTKSLQTAQESAAASQLRTLEAEESEPYQALAAAFARGNEMQTLRWCEQLPTQSHLWPLRHVTAVAGGSDLVVRPEIGPIYGLARSGDDQSIYLAGKRGLTTMRRAMARDPLIWKGRFVRVAVGNGTLWGVSAGGTLESRDLTTGSESSRKLVEPRSMANLDFGMGESGIECSFGNETWRARTGSSGAVEFERSTRHRVGTQLMVNGVAHIVDWDGRLFSKEREIGQLMTDRLSSFNSDESARLARADPDSDGRAIFTLPEATNAQRIRTRFPAPVVANGAISLIAAAGKNEVRVWKIGDNTLTPVARFSDLQFTVTSLCIRPVQRELVVGGASGELLVYWIDAPDRSPRRFHGHVGLISDLGIDPSDSDRVVSSSLDGTVRIWSPDRPLGSRVIAVPAPASRVRFGAGKEVLVCAAGRLLGLKENGSWADIATVGPVTDIETDPGGTHVLVAINDRFQVLSGANGWQDIGGGSLGSPIVALSLDVGPTTAGAIDGPVVAVASRSATAKGRTQVWKRIAAQWQLATESRQAPMSVFLRRGCEPVLTAHANYDVGTGSELSLSGKIKDASTGQMREISASGYRDSIGEPVPRELVAVSSTPRYSVAIVRTDWIENTSAVCSTGSRVRPLGPLIPGIQSIVFHPTEPIVAAAGRELGVWNARTGRLMLTLPLPSRAVSMAFDPSGCQLAIALETPEVMILDSISAPPTPPIQVRDRGADQVP